MKIGIIVHTKSGTTLGFARRIAEKLKEGKQKVELIELKAEGDIQPRATHVSITNIPDCKGFDALLIGGPVWGFAASPVILSCIKHLKGISGMKVLPFVTMGFPFTGMGGKQAIAQMGSALKAAGANVLPGTIIPKMFHNTNQTMEKAASEIAALLA